MNSVAKKLSVTVAVMVAVWSVSMTASYAETDTDTSLDEELEHYWATERDMRVIEDRLYERGGRFGVGVFTGLLSSEPFFHYYPVGGRLTYNFSNSIGVEAGGSFMDAGALTRDTELTEFLRDQRGQAGFDPAKHAEDRFLWRANALVLWSPFYGKLAALQQKLWHFDINFGAGFGAVGVERPELSREDAMETTAVEFVVGAGVHFFLTDSILMRFDGRGFLYQGAELPTNEGSTFGRLKFPMEFNLGFTYLF